MRKAIIPFLAIFLAAGPTLLGFPNVPPAQALSPSPVPYITSLSPSSGTVGTTVTITGSSFSGATGNPANSIVRFGGATIPSSSISDASISFVVPSGITPCSLDPQMSCVQVVTPIVPGSYEVQVAAPTSTNSSTFYTSNTLTFTVTSSDLSITTSSPLPNAKVGVWSSAWIQSSTAGDNSGYTPTWSVSAGSLPPGMALGVLYEPCSPPPGVYCSPPAPVPGITGIGGTPTTAGTYTFTISLTVNGQTVSKQFTMTVDPAGSSLTITTSSTLPNAKVGVWSSTTITSSAMGDNSGYYPSWSVSAGSLPPGMTLGEFYQPCTGTICPQVAPPSPGMTAVGGTPTVAGTYTFTISVTLNGQTASKQFVMTVDPADSSNLSIITSSPLPNAKVGISYSKYLEASGGNGLYQWGLYEGTMPQGLGVGIVGANNGNIFGTPTIAGTYTFSVQVSSGTNFAVKQFTLTIDPATESQVNKKPLGWLDSITDGQINGWAYDPNHPNDSIIFHIYFDGPASPGRGVSAAVANVFRGDVNQVFSISGTHGLSFPIPQNFRDGRSHSVYVYAIDKDDSTGASNVQLYGSGKTFVLGSSTDTTTRHPRGSVVIDSTGTVYYLGDVLRYPFPNPQVFFSWGHTFSSLVPANSGDLAMPVGPMVTMKY